MRDYIRLIKFVKPHLWVFIAAAVCMVVSSLFSGGSITSIIPLVDNILSKGKIVISADAKIPDFILGIINKINSLPLSTLLNYLALWVIATFLIHQIFLFLQSYLMNDLSQRAVRDVKDKLYGHLMGLSMDYYSRNPASKTMSRVTYDTTVIRDSISEGLTDLVYQPIQLLVYVGLVLVVRAYFSISWLLLIVSMVVLPLIIYPVVQIGRRLRKISRQTQEKMADINTILYETLTGINIVKAFTNEMNELARFKAKNKQFYKIMMRSILRMALISPVTELIGATGVAIVIWLGGKEITSGHLSAGAFVTFLATVLLMMKPFKRLSRVYGIVQQALAAGERIFEVLDTEPSVVEKTGALELPAVKNKISFEGVYFKYEDEEILKDINLDIKVGDVVAFVGPSGVGKTTLVNLIPRFYDPTRGRVSIDGINIADVSLYSLRKQIGIVTQDMILFDDTVKANIAYGKGRGAEINDEEVIRAAKIANAHDFIMAMPNGYNTMIGERGVRISGGEKQRLVIGRAIFQDPPILILDEATSQLDAESERQVQSALDRAMERRTVLIIAHRLSTVRNADKIIILDKGKITEIGTHEDLIARGGLYKRLYEMQFQET